MIVGAGLAGGTAAATLRAEGFDGRIVMVGDETHLPYSRPPLSKGVLRSEQTVDKAQLRPEDWYGAQEIELCLCAPAVAISPREHTVELEDGRHLRYDRLLLATGGKARNLTVPGALLPGIFTLRTLDDALAIRERLQPGAAVVVIGAGFIGAEVAASARILGCAVTIIEMLSAPLVRVLGGEIGAIYAAMHREHGVDLRLGIGVTRFDGDDRVRRVVGTDGRAYEADVVVVGIGIDPEVELARSAGLAVDNGVSVDEHCRTSAVDVYAAGDIAFHPNQILARRIRVEHWQNAQHQGAAAAKNMLGRNQSFTEVPWFWSDQYEHNLQMAGYPESTDRVLFRGDVDTLDFSAFFVRDRRLTGAIGVNRPLDVRAARRLIQEKATPDEHSLTDDSVNLLEMPIGRAS